MASVGREAPRAVAGVGEAAHRAVVVLGDLAIFGARTLGGMVRRAPVRGTLAASLYAVGVRSVPVVAVTGLFIGMVLAVQSYSEFHHLGMATRLGSIITISVVRELGPVLAATMIAGRVGTAMAAELGTMRVTEQVDAVTCLGLNPLHYLVAPRFLACLLLTPLLTVLADFTGMMGGAVICTQVYHIETHHYWLHARQYVGLWDISTGLVKAAFFGAAIALLSCHRGLNCRPGAEGVGRAATEAFVASFIAILVLDFFLALFLNELYDRFGPAGGPRLV